MSLNNQSILVVEDNDDDFLLLKRACGAAGIAENLQHVTDGEMAVHYLRGVDRFRDRVSYPKPRLVLLDLKLPRKHGLEVLDWIHEQPDLKSLVVIVLTSSQEKYDLERAYAAGANAYLVKPPSYAQLLESIKSLKEFWLKHNIFHASPTTMA